MRAINISRVSRLRSRAAARPDRATRSARRRLLALTAVGALSATLLSACGGDGKATLNWYINPDGQETLTALAAQCSQGKPYDIKIQLLPSGATDQRTQLARRLAARDSSTDLMSLDPVFVAEFKEAGWLAQLPDDVAQQVTDGVLAGPKQTVTFDDGVYAAPQWANTQVLWYRKSLAQAAGLDMSQPVTWQQIISAASENGGKVGVQANKYEGYVVWINALIQGAGGDIVSDPEAGKDAQVDLDSDAGRAAATVVSDLAHSSAAPADLSVSNEGTELGAMFSGAGEFLVNWTFTYQSLTKGLSDEQKNDLGWARYPRTVQGEESKPPVGGIDIGVGAYSQHPDWAIEAAQCVTADDAQTALAVNDGLMPARGSLYSGEELKKTYPESLLQLWQQSLASGGPRPTSAYYAEISQAVQNSWHPASSVNPDTTPADSASFLRDVLAGKALL